MHDRASVNGAAMRTIKVVFPSLVNIGCYSHTIDLAGEKFDVPVLDHSSFTVLSPVCRSNSFTCGSAGLLTVHMQK